MMELIFWTVFWWIIGNLVRYVVSIPEKIQEVSENKKRDRATIEYQNHFISMIHAIWVISSCSYALLKYPLDKGRDWTDIEMTMLQSSLCYFIYDTIYGFIYAYNDIWMNLHHMMIFLVYYISFKSYVDHS